jgi:hypothetical protein
MCVEKISTINSLRKFFNDWQGLFFFFSALGTFILAFIAVFQDHLRDLFYSPKLDIELGPFYLGANQVPIRDKISKRFLANAYYLQIPVTNKGATAKEIEIFIKKIEKEVNSKFQVIESFSSMSLNWSHYDHPILHRIHKNSSRECTLGRIVDPKRKIIAGDSYEFLDQDNLDNNISPFRL